MDTITFNKVWCAFPQRANAFYKKLAFDHKNGDLIINTKLGLFSYKSQFVNLESFKILSITQKRQIPPLLNYIQNSLIVSLLMIARSNTYLYVIAGLLIGWILGLSIWYSMKWIVIEYEDPEKTNGQFIWFYDGSYRGWRGMFGGTKKMFVKIISALASLSLRVEKKS